MPLLLAYFLHPCHFDRLAALFCQSGSTDRASRDGRPRYQQVPTYRVSRIDKKLYNSIV